MQYRNGNYTAAASPALITMKLGFVPDHVILYSLGTTTPTTGITRVEWMKGMAVPSAFVTTSTSGAGVVTYITTNGITPYSIGGDWLSTQYTIDSISKGNPGVVTVATISPTNSLTLVNGMTVTISGVNGMTQVNTNRYIVANLTIVSSGPTYTFSLYDLFGNPVDTTAFGTFATSPNAQLNEISYPPLPPVLNPVTGQVVTQGQPAGNQYDMGSAGFTIGTSVQTASTNYFWEAFLQTPTGY